MRRSLLAGALALGIMACHSPVQTYEGPSRPGSEVARVIGLTEPNLFVAVATQQGARPASGMPTAIQVVDVDGRDLVEESEVVELLPGPHVLGIYGRRVELNPDRVVSNYVLLEFRAEAGATYLLKAKPSEHQRPWSYRLLDRATKNVVATSEPKLEDLELLALPAEASAWDVLAWNVTTHYTGATYAGSPDDQGEPTEFLQRERIKFREQLTPTTLRYRRVRERRIAGHSVEDTDLEGDRWMERWRMLEPDADGHQRIGVSVNRVTDGILDVMLYATCVDARGVDDVDAERRRDEWQTLILQRN